MTRDRHAAHAEALARRAELIAQRAEQRLKRRNEHAARVYAERSRREERSEARRDERRRNGVERAMRESDKRVNQQVLGAVLLAIGGNWLLAELGLFTFGWPGLFAVALMTLGMSMAFTAKAGRTKPLIALGIVLTLGLAMSSGVSSPVRGQNFGDFHYNPVSASQVRENYMAGVGDMTIDLSRVDFPDGLRNVNARLTVGELRVIVPPGLPVDVDAEISGPGEIKIFDSGLQDGIGVRDTFRDKAFSESGPRLDLDLDISAVGEITVERR